MAARGRRLVACAGLFAIGAAIAGCSGSMSSLRQSAQAQPTAVSQATATPAPMAAAPRVEGMASPTATARPAMPSPTATASPVPPTPVLVFPMRISAHLDPPTPRAGVEFTVRLIVANDDNVRSARGVYVATSGPWDRWTVLEISPGGIFARDAAGWHLISAIVIPPHDVRAIDLLVRADEPSEEQLTFAVREAEPAELQVLPTATPTPG